VVAKEVRVAYADDLMGMLREARARLDNCRAILGRMRVTPELLSIAEKYAELEGRQRLLEAAVSAPVGEIRGRDDLGFIPLPIIGVMASALLASTAASLIYFTRVKKHLEETRAFEAYLSCLEEARREGLTLKEARECCLGPYAKSGEWLRLVLIGAGVVGGMLLLGRLIR